MTYRELLLAQRDFIIGWVTAMVAPYETFFDFIESELERVS